MTSNVLLLVVAAVFVGVVILGAVVRASRRSSGSRPVDAGAVSTRWLSELRRDEPWTRS